MTHPIIRAHRRQQLEQWIERAIAILDLMDGDTDIEDDTEHDEAEADAPGLIRGGSRGRTMTHQAQHQPRPLSELKANECRWAVNDAALGEPHLFYGLPVKPTLPYSPDHCHRAYAKRDGV